MLLTTVLFNKGSFLGSLINKCRQVVRIKSEKHLETNLKPNISNSPTITTYKISAAPTESYTRPVAVANISLSSTANATKTVEEKVGLPPRPKRPLTPYFRFMKDLRPKIAADNPKLSIIDVVVQVSKKWESADASLKQRLQEEYKKDQQIYVENRTKYDAKITDDQRSQIQVLKQEISETKVKRMMRKRIKDLGRPKKPASAFIRFVAKQRIQIPRTTKQTFREWQLEVTARWSSLSQAEKEVYLQESRKEFEKHKKELSAWEEKMIRLGHIDVVRHSNLIDPPEPKPRKH